MEFARETVVGDAPRQDYSDIEDQSDLGLFDGNKETLIVRLGLKKQPKDFGAAPRVSVLLHDKRNF